MFNDEDMIKLLENRIKNLDFYGYNDFLIKNIEFFQRKANEIYNLLFNYCTGNKERLEKSFDYKFTPISINEMYKITQKFLDEYKIKLDIYELINSQKIVLNDIKEKLKKKEISQVEYKTLSFSGNTSAEGIITINFSGNVIDCAVLLHELIHTYNLPSNKKRSLTNDYLTETISYGEEFIFLNYLETLGYKNDALNLFNIVYYNTFKLSNNVYYVCKAINLYFKKNSLSKAAYQSLYQNTKDYELCLKNLYNCIIKYNYLYKLIWLWTGYIGGLYYYENYLKDSNYFKVIEKINELIKINNTSWQVIFSTLEVKNPNELFNEITNSLKNLLNNSITLDK